MDERAIKRLLITLGVAIVIIMVAKYMLTKAVTNVGKVALEKKQAVVVQPAAEPATEELASGVADTTTMAIDTSSAASAVEPTPH